MEVVDDWMYFGSYGQSNYSIFRMKTDGTEQTLLANFIADFFNVVDNVVYFSGKVNYNSNANIYSMNTDGTNLKQLTNIDSFNMQGNYYNGYIYYTNWTWTGDGYTPEKLHRVKTDGTDDNILSDAHCSSINIYNEKIYYVNYDNGYVYKMNLDGTGNALLADVATYRLCINNDSIYMESTQLYSIKSDGTDFKTLVNIYEPKGLVTETASYNTINLKWYGVFGASGYSIYRYNGTEYIKIVDLSTLQYTETQTYSNSSLAFNTKYSYKVKAYVIVKDGVKQYSGFSNPSYATTALDAPTLYRVASNSYNSLKLTWSSIAGATGYTVYRLVNKSYVAITNSSTLTFVDTGLVTGTTYYYKINAYRIVNGISVYGASSYVVSASPILNVPGSFHAGRTNTGEIMLTWTAVAGANGYTIYRQMANTYKAIANVTSLS